jgi:hypothetical protein
MAIAGAPTSASNILRRGIRLSWIGMLPSILGPSGLGVIHTRLPDTFSIGSANIVFPLWITVASFGPTLAALVAQKLCYGRLRGFHLWTSLRQILIGTIVGMLCGSHWSRSPV